MTIPVAGTDLGPGTGCANWPTGRDRTSVVTVGRHGADVALVPDGYKAEAGWRSVSRNLLVKID